MSTKREAREFLLQFFFHFQLPLFEKEREGLEKEFDSTEIFERVQEFKKTLAVELSSEHQAYVASCVRGIFENLKRIEEVITKHLKNWKLSRLSRVEHTLLIIAAYELLFHPEVPHKVVINEALELAKKYSTKDSSSFLNGVLDSILKNECHRDD